MPLGILNNIPSLAAENELTLTSSALNSTLEQLSSGSRINTGADDPAGLAIANGLQANISALTRCRMRTMVWASCNWQMAHWPRSPTC